MVTKLILHKEFEPKIAMDLTFANTKIEPTLPNLGFKIEQIHLIQL